MTDLSDDELTTIIATVTGDQSDLSGDARFEAMRAAIAADRALNAAPSVGAEGLLGFAAWWRDNFEAGTPQDASFAEAERCARVVWMAALASRPAVDADKRDAERYRWLRDGCDEKHSRASHIAKHCYGLEWDAAIDAARHPAQREGE